MDESPLQPHRAEIVVEWRPSASIGEAKAVRHVLESICEGAMEALLGLEVVDPTVELDCGDPTAEGVGEFVHPATFDARKYSAEIARLHRKDPTPTGTCVVCPGHRWPCAAARLASAVNQLLEADRG